MAVDAEKGAWLDTPDDSCVCFVDRMVPALAESAGAQRMLEETVDLARKAMEAGAHLNVIANNRAYGNAPALARDAARQLLDTG